MGAMDRNKEFNRVFNRAYARDGKLIHTGEALLLGMLMHTHGEGRNSKQMQDLLVLMQDKNVDVKPKRHKN
jgi:hypothetical protein